MFELIQSNRAAVPADVFCERNGEPGDPFVPLSVVVQNHGQAQWLKHRLAAAHGVAANVSCEFLAAFLWRLCRRLPNAAPLTHPEAGIRRAPATAGRPRATPCLS